MKDWQDMDDAELAELSRAVAGLRPSVRDVVRERIAFTRTMLEITGCRTGRDALEQVKVWKGKADGTPRITGN